MNSRPPIALATLVTAGISCVGIAQAQIPSLNITENSSTSLTATLNGVPQTVLPGSQADLWNITFTTISVDFGVALWQEPGETTRNLVTADALGGLIVSSDTDFIGIPNPDGATDFTDITINGGFILAVTFTDLGDSSSRVPDTATTFGLLGLSLAALGTLAKARPLIFGPFNG